MVRHGLPKEVVKSPGVVQEAFRVEIVLAGMELLFTTAMLCSASHLWLALDWPGLLLGCSGSSQTLSNVPKAYRLRECRGVNRRWRKFWGGLVVHIEALISKMWPNMAC